MTALVLTSPLLAGADFPAAPFHAIRARVAAACKPQPTQPPAYSHFTAAWDAVQYRFGELDAHCHDLVQHLLQRSEDLAQQQRRERELLDFMVSGVSMLESAAFAMFAIGGLTRPDRFPLTTPLDRRNATTGATLRLYHECFHAENLTRVLFWHYNSRDYAWWKEARNLLSQEIGSFERDAARWLIGGVSLDAPELTRQRKLMVTALSEILEAAAPFVHAQLGGTPDALRTAAS